MENQKTISELSQRIQYIESKLFSPSSPDILKITDLEISNSKKSPGIKAKSKISELEDYCQNLLQENEKLNKICRIKENENKLLKEKLEGRLSQRNSDYNSNYFKNHFVCVCVFLFYIFLLDFHKGKSKFNFFLFFLSFPKYK